LKLDELQIDKSTGKKKRFSFDDDLRSAKSETAGVLLWNLFQNLPKSVQTEMENITRPSNELDGLMEMTNELTEGEIAVRLDEATIEWIERLWHHLKEFQENTSGNEANIRDARRAFEKLSPRGPLYISKKYEKKLREIARLWRIHYPLLGIIDLAPFPNFLATPGDRWEKIGKKSYAAEHFLVPGHHPNEWRKKSRATVPLHQCAFKDFEQRVIQVLVLDPFGESSGGGAFLDEMLRRELQRADIPHADSPEGVDV
jgi:hypothetical protein